MATLHVRNVPEPVYEALRARALRNGRSINAEVVAILHEALTQPDTEELIARIRARAERIALPPEAPAPEDVIRELRDRG